MRPFLSLSTILLLLFFSSCEKNENDIQTTYIGDKINIGNGQAWTIIETNQDLHPVSLGVQFTEDALVNLPTGSTHADEFMLKLNPSIPIPPYDHITLDWNEHGHEPMHVYDKPHFDIHFYMMSEAQRNTIGPNDDAAFNKALPAPYLPTDYLETPGGVPRMGAHIIDLTSPEIAGTGAFTYTFIYGKYDGQVNFLEPMVTKEYLESKTDMAKEVRQPQAWKQAGYYPKNYSISFDNQTKIYSIMLTELTQY